MKIVKKLILMLLTISIAASMLTVFALADGTLAYGAATVSGDGLRLRSGPGTTYSVVIYLNEGDIVVILERTNSEWYQVNFHGNIGYVSVPLLRDILTAENFNAQGKVIGDRVNMRAKPNTTSEVLGSYSKNTVMTVIGINNGWYKVKHDSKTGYIRSDFMEIIGGQNTSSSSSSSSVSSSSSTSTAPAANLTVGQKIADFALGFVGSRYVYGGTSPTGFDCSGLVYYTYRNFGYKLTRNASGQYRDNGVRVQRSELAPGDLVFFSRHGNGITHVGIYIGGNEFVHASSPSVGVVVSRLDSSYYTTGWYGAKRIVTG